MMPATAGDTCVWVLEPAGDRGRVVTADRHGIRSERVTRRGRRRTAEVSWDDIRDVLVSTVHLQVDGGRGPITSGFGSHEPAYRAIADHVEERITPPEGRRRLPIVDGWTAWLDDRGPTLSTRRESRRKVARWAGALAGVLWVDTAAAATDLGELWGLAAVLGAAAAGLTATAVSLARGRGGDPVPRPARVPGEERPWLRPGEGCSSPCSAAPKGSPGARRPPACGRPSPRRSASPWAAGDPAGRRP